MGIDAFDIAYRIRRQLGVDLSQDEFVYFSGTAGWLHEVVCAKLDGCQPAIPDLWSIQRKVQVWLAQQPRYRWWRVAFTDGRISAIVPDQELPAAWQDLLRYLSCQLPDLERAEAESARLPSGCETLSELARWLARYYPNVVLPIRRESRESPLCSATKWSPEQVWQELQQILCETLGVAREMVTPEARLIEDLGMN